MKYVINRLSLIKSQYKNFSAHSRICVWVCVGVCGLLYYYPSLKDDADKIMSWVDICPSLKQHQNSKAEKKTQREANVVTQFPLNSNIISDSVALRYITFKFICATNVNKPGDHPKSYGRKKRAKHTHTHTHFFYIVRVKVTDFQFK